MSCNLEQHHTIQQVADKLNLNHKTVRKLIKKGQLVARKVGGVLRIPDSAVGTYLEGCKVYVPKEAPRPAARPRQTGGVFKYL
jgi:excisionase family DNA binding protein